MLSKSTWFADFRNICQWLNNFWVAFHVSLRFETLFFRRNSETQFQVSCNEQSNIAHETSINLNQRHGKQSGKCPTVSKVT